MKQKMIDAAIEAYTSKKTGASENDRARLDFFQKVWAMQMAISEEMSDQIKYEVPAQDDLVAWYKAEEPILLHAPVVIPELTLVAAIEKCAACLVEYGEFTEIVLNAFNEINWGDLVAKSDLALAGGNPSEYVISCRQALVNEGLEESASRVAALAIMLAIRALLEIPAAEVKAALKAAGVEHPHPIHCPVCGGPAVVARVGVTESVEGRGKELWCSQCGTSWEFERVRCARCGTQNQAHLHFFNVEGDEAHRIATCDECGGYVRTVYEEDNLAPFSFEVEDVVMARLDWIAYRQAQSQYEQQEFVNRMSAKAEERSGE